MSEADRPIKVEVVCPAMKSEATLGATAAWCEAVAACLNRLRILPRLLVLGYGLLLYQTVHWAMSLPEISTQQTSLVGAVVGMSPAFFAFYMQGGATRGKTE